MSCFRPIEAARDRVSGKVVIGRWSGTDGMDNLELPCGKCEGCLMDRARAWRIRIMHEAQLYLENYMVTYTYDDSHLPENGSLCYRDLQLMFKRLRKNGRRFKFFCSGEYGTVNLRPHYHVIYFGLSLPDKSEFVNGTYRSKWLSSFWPNGDGETEGPVILPVTSASAAYVSQYCMKKVYGRAAREHYGKRVPEFIQMSRGGRTGVGVGGEWFAAFGSDLFPADRAVRDGKEWPVPRYYFEKLKELGNGNLIEDITERRISRAKLHLEDNTERRRMAREIVAIRRRLLFERKSL